MPKFTKRTVIFKRTFYPNDWASFHDAVLDSTGESHSQHELEQIFKELPEGIRMTAIQWGMSNTVFGDEVYRHFKKPEPKTQEKAHNP